MGGWVDLIAFSSRSLALSLSLSLFLRPLRPAAHYPTTQPRTTDPPLCPQHSSQRLTHPPIQPTVGKVRKGGGKSGSSKAIPDSVTSNLKQKWADVLAGPTGHADYAALKAAVTAERG